MLFNKIFSIVNKIFELDNESIYFCSTIPNNITPVLISKNKAYNLDLSKTYRESIDSLKLNIYIIKSNVTFNITCLDRGTKAIVITIDHNLLENSIEHVIGIIENIYEYIFKELSKIYCMEFNTDVMKKIFTLFTTQRYFGNLNMKDFHLKGIVSEDIATMILKEHDIISLYDNNMIDIIL